MNTEYEATFSDVGKKDIRTRLKNTGATLKRPEFLQKRVNYELPEGSPMKTGWLRVRNEGDKITLSLKAILNNDEIEGQKEICLTVDSFKQAEELLKSLGCTYKAYQESKREIWELDGVEVCIDEWPWLEPFVEIEASAHTCHPALDAGSQNNRDETSDQVRSDTKERVRAVAEKLGLHWSEAIFGAVDVQYEKKYGVSKKCINNETPRFVFGEPCPFVGIKHES